MPGVFRGLSLFSASGFTSVPARLCPTLPGPVETAGKWFCDKSMPSCTRPTDRWTGVGWWEQWKTALGANAYATIVVRGQCDRTNYSALKTLSPLRFATGRFDTFSRFDEGRERFRPEHGPTRGIYYLSSHFAPRPRSICTRTRVPRPRSSARQTEQ